MFKDQTMFITLQKYGNFNVGKKLKMKVEGMERVHPKLYNDKVQDIPNVRYVPTAN